METSNEEDETHLPSRIPRSQHRYTAMRARVECSGHGSRRRTYSRDQPEGMPFVPQVICGDFPTSSPTGQTLTSEAITDNFGAEDDVLTQERNGTAHQLMMLRAQAFPHILIQPFFG